MNIQSVINKGGFIQGEDGFNYFKSSLKLDLYNNEIILEIHNVSDFKDSVLKDKVEKTLIQVSLFLQKSIADLTKETWDHYQAIISDCSYGFVNYENSSEVKTANEAHFGYKNQSECFQAITLESVWFDMDFDDSINCNLIFDCPWEDEHNFNVLLENGQISEVY